MIYILFLAFTLSILAFAFYQIQYFMVFSPVYYRKDELDEHFEMLSITTDDGIKLEGVIYTPQNPHAVILFFGGKSHDSVGLIKRLSIQFPHAAIVTFNYRSYGKSQGYISEKNIFEDALLVAQKVQQYYGEFYLLGFSLGSSVASYVASKHQTKGVFLVGPFDSIAEMAKKKFGFDISRFLRYKFDNTDFACRIDASTYIFASKDDDVISIENVRNLKKNFKNLIYYEELEGLTHDEILWDERVIKKISEVIG